MNKERTPRRRIVLGAVAVVGVAVLGITPAMTLQAMASQSAKQNTTTTTLSPPTVNGTTLSPSGSAYQARSGDHVTLSAQTTSSSGSLTGSASASLTITDTTTNTTMKSCSLGTASQSSLTCTAVVSDSAATDAYVASFSDPTNANSSSTSSALSISWVAPIATTVSAAAGTTSPTPGETVPITGTTPVGTTSGGGTPNGSSNSDPRANGYGGNVTTCSAIGLATDTELTANDAGASDANLSGTVGPNQGTTQPGQGQELDVTQLSSTVVVDAIVVKGGNGYNEYTQAAYLPPLLAPNQHYISPLNGGGNVPTISHWFVCYHFGTPPSAGQPVGTISITLQSSANNVPGGLLCLIGTSPCGVSTVNGQQTVTCVAASSCQALEAPQAPGTSATFAVTYQPTNPADPALPYYASASVTVTVSWATASTASLEYFPT